MYFIWLHFLLSLFVAYVAGNQNQGVAENIIERFGCTFLNEDYELQPQPVVNPQWSNKEIPAFKLNSYVSPAVMNIIDDIIVEFYSKPFNTIQNFINFYDDYKMASPSNFSKFVKHYKVKKSNDVNQNIALMERIIQDEHLNRITPGIADSVFLAATIQYLDIDYINEMTVETIHKYNHFKHAIVAIKISYTGEAGPPPRYELEPPKYGYIFLDVESNLPHKVVILTHPIRAREFETGNSFFNRMIKHRNYETDFLSPISVRDTLKLAGLTSKYGILRYKPLDSNNNFIYGKVSNYEVYPIERSNEDEGLIIYVGCPYCSFMETTEKYKLLSPFRVFVGRCTDNLMKGNVLVGLFFNVQTNITKFSFIEPNLFEYQDGSDPIIYYAETRDEEFQNFNVDNLEDLDEQNQDILRVVSGAMQVEEIELLDLIQRMGTIISDHVFVNLVKAERYKLSKILAYNLAA